MAHPRTPIERRLLSIQEVAGYTGLSVHTLYTMVSQRRIPFVKVGRLTKFDRRLLDEWIAGNTVMPMPPKRF
jgi:excisionase family DNA binding protein